MTEVRYETIKKIASPLSNASSNERAIAMALLEIEDSNRQCQAEEEELRVTVSKGVSAGSTIVKRKDGKGAVTIMGDPDEYSAIEFCNSSLRLRLTEKEERFVCEKLNLQR